MKIDDDVKKLVSDIDNVQHSMECTLGECEYLKECDGHGVCYVACMMVQRLVIEKARNAYSDGLSDVVLVEEGRK